MASITNTANGNSSSGTIPKSPPATSSSGGLASALFNRKKPAKTKKKQTPPPSRPNGRVTTPTEAQPLSSADDGQFDDLADQLLLQLDARDASNDKASSKRIESVPDSSASIVSQASESSQRSTSSSRSLKEGVKDLFSPARAKSRQHAKREKREQEIIQMQLAARRELQENKDTDWAEEEHAEMMRICKSLNAELREIPPDGHCLYAALADQINSHRFNRELETFQTVRTGVAGHMRQNPDDFLPFLLSESTEDDGLMNPEAFSTYCDKIEKTTEWGGQPEIIAASKAFKVPVHVYQAHTRTVRIGDEDFPKAMPLRYHRHMYGLGEHYNSLRQRIDFNSTFIAPTF